MLECVQIRVGVDTIADGTLLIPGYHVEQHGQALMRCRTTREETVLQIEWRALRIAVELHHGSGHDEAHPSAVGGPLSKRP